MFPLDLPPDLPRTLEKFTTRPWALFTSGRKVLVTSIVPQRLTSAVRLKCSSGVHSMGPREAIPALFTRPHNPSDRETRKIIQKPFGDSFNSALLCAGPTNKHYYLSPLRRKISGDTLPFSHTLVQKGGNEIEGNFYHGEIV